MNRRIATLALALCAMALALAPRPASADPSNAKSPAPAAGTWGAELESVAQWLAQHTASPGCTDHCFVLGRLRLTGAPGDQMKFALDGAVVGGSRVAVPLFGPPPHARLDKVTENGKPAAVGFEGDHWYVLTSSPRFVIEGTLALDDDLALTIPGPLDALDADLSRGRVVEGAHLSGLEGATIHFDRDTGVRPAAEPPVFQLSRAVRVAREVTFEYRLVMRSGQDLGVVRLPLAFGEKVLDVQGSSGWSVQGTELVLPTAGRAAQMTITGTLAKAGRFEPDARSAYEWWLIESDAEHRLGVSGDARQIDAAESPIARTQASARLLLVARGQHVDVDVQTLVATDALAAVVRQHDRTIVLTARGDLVTDDVLAYENDGIDWLAWPPTGRAVFLATDGVAERVMRQSDGAGEVLVPLRVGSHQIHLQAMSAAPIAALGGVLTVPTPTHALTASRATATVGLPANVHPLAVLGGDHAWLAFCAADAAALAASIGIAIALLRGRPRRALGAVALGGLWLLSPPAWGLLVGSGVALLFAWAAARLLSRPLRIMAWSGIGVAALAIAVAGECGSAKAPPIGRIADGEIAGTTAPAAPAASAVPVDLPKAKMQYAQRAMGKELQDLASGEINARGALGGIAQGVAPVALTMPEYARSVFATRELVTQDRPFVVRVVYVTTGALLPLLLAWLAGVVLLARLHRVELAALVRRTREALARRPEPDPAPTHHAAPEAPPPVVA
jgi:hypothetical protein